MRSRSTTLRIHCAPHSADARYILYINGKRIGYGPARSYHAHYEFDTYDLAPRLVVGQNCVAVRVLHWGEGTFQRVVGRDGLLVQVEHEGQVLLATDGTWRVQRDAAFCQATPRIACQLSWEEQFDAQREDRGWQHADFDAAAWDHATVIGPVGNAPWGELTPRTIPFLTDEPVTSIQVTPWGTVRRPDVVAALHAAPYLAPDDLSANTHSVDGVFVALLHVPEAGVVTLKRSSQYGASPRVFVGGMELAMQPATPDDAATMWLEPGPHVLILDWQGTAHDLDVTLTASGVAIKASGRINPARQDRIDPPLNSV